MEKEARAPSVTEVAGVRLAARNTRNRRGTDMNARGDDSLRERKTTLLDGMREYMQDGDVSYGETHVRRCETILDAFDAAISGASGRDDALTHVRAAVLQLNALNDECEGELIETDQREMICELINSTTARRGFISADEDVTEEWREW
jgi:hypothetical protein